MKRVALVAALTIFTAGGSGGAYQGAARQSYGAWTYNAEKKYHYREYKYKVNAGDKEYQHQYCIYFKADPKVNNKWVYFYNPATEKYWGRYPTVNNDTYKVQAEKRQEVWSELPDKYRQKDIYQIDAKSWPEPKQNYCPAIPGAADATPMLSPPPDLP